MGTVMYVVEGPENGFSNMPVAIYWAITTMTTVGFGDITPKTGLGRFIASLMMLIGWGMLAVPTGIVTAEFTRLRFPRRAVGRRLALRRVRRHGPRRRARAIARIAARDFRATRRRPAAPAECARSGGQCVEDCAAAGQRCRRRVRARRPLDPDRVAELVRAVAARVELGIDARQRRRRHECAQQGVVARAGLVAAADDGIDDAEQRRRTEPVVGDAGAGGDPARPEPAPAPEAPPDRVVDTQDFPKDPGPFKEPVPHSGGKTGATDVHPWVKGLRPHVGESGNEFADRIMRLRYPDRAAFDKGAGSEWNQIKKCGDRHFKDPSRT